MATIIELKAEIKELASNQTYLRDQSKSKYNKHPREMYYIDAQRRHSQSRNQLRCMYFAYGLLRGRSFAEMEKIYSPLNVYNKATVAKWQFEYGEEVVRSDR